jgi:hypothetical protein
MKYIITYDTILEVGKNVEITNKKRREKRNEQLILSVIENASNAVRSAYCFSQWITIHQGNDSY